MSETEWYGDMGDGTAAPANSDTARINWLSGNQKSVKNLLAGVKTVGIDVWQPGLRAAIDAAMELARRKLRSKGLEPEW